MDHARPCGALSHQRVQPQHELHVYEARGGVLLSPPFIFKAPSLSHTSNDRYRIMHFNAVSVSDYS